MLQKTLDLLGQLSPEDAGKAAVEAMVIVGQHGREAGEALKTACAAPETDKANLEEGFDWLEEGTRDLF